MSNDQQKRDIAHARHGMYIAMKDAGVLVNGHMLKRGYRETDRKKEDSKTTCRQKVIDDDDDNND